jgi:nicotinate-nucleotide adenylyltransferase
MTANVNSKKKTRIGLFFGSYNPIHIGHMVIANYMVEYADIDQVWMVISPHNPLKEKKSLIASHHRYAMVNLAVEDEPRFKACNIELKLPKPSYTIDTLIRLDEKYPDHEFLLIAGTDIFPTFHKWKNYQELIKHYWIYAYKRPGFDIGTYKDHYHIKLFDAPQMDISASFIRQAIKEKRDIRHFLPPKVYQYITEMHFYEK